MGMACSSIYVAVREDNPILADDIRNVLIRHCRNVKGTGRGLLAPKCVPQLFLGLLMARAASADQLLANFLLLSLVTAPEVFAKVNSTQLLRWRLAINRS